MTLPHGGLQGIDGRMKKRVGVQSMMVRGKNKLAYTLVLQCGWSRQEVCPLVELAMEMKARQSISTT